MKITLDAIDQQILNMLQEDAKINIKEIAAKLNMTKTPIYERIKRLEKEGIIEKYVTLLDRSKLTSSIIVFALPNFIPDVLAKSRSCSFPGLLPSPQKLILCSAPGPLLKVKSYAGVADQS